MICLVVARVLYMDISNRDIAWYELALKIAADSDAYDKHGCVLVRSGTVLGVATNRQGLSHPISKAFNKGGLHAEQRLLYRVKNAEGAILYSARDHQNLISIPCWMCSTLIYKAGIKWVVFHDGSSIQRVRVHKVVQNQLYTFRLKK